MQAKESHSGVSPLTGEPPNETNTKTKKGTKVNNLNFP